MSGDPLHADEIERVDPPPEDRTDDRDRAADIIEEEWPTTMTALDEKYEYTRQHFRNTLSQYFKPAGENGNNMETTMDDGPDLNLPGHERELLQAYRMGYRDGFQDGRDEGDD